MIVLNNSMYSKTEAAYRILKKYKKPLHVMEIIRIALEKNMISTKGKTPESTLAADLLLENRRKEKQKKKPRFYKARPATWGLTEWK